jgi:ribose 5-phosphate isomerase A
LAVAGRSDGDRRLHPGARGGRLPVEAIPFALPPCERRLTELGRLPVPYHQGDAVFVADSGDHTLDCQADPIADAPRLGADIRAIPGVVGAGLFLGRTETVPVGDRDDLRLIEGRRGGRLIRPAGKEAVR